MGRAQGRTTAAGPSRRPRGPYKWTSERIEEELNEFLGERDDWPTAEEFAEAGHRTLLAAIQRSPGGLAYWASRVGLDLAPRQNRAPYPLHIALAEAQALIDEHGKLPSMMRLRELGHVRLAYLVQRAGGARAFCAQHGLTR